MDMSTITFWSIMKWVLIVLAAGFIGQFGKIFATHLLERVRAKRAAKQGGRPDNPPGAITEQPRDVALPDKKALKTQAKMRKKEFKSLEK